MNSEKSINIKAAIKEGLKIGSNKDDSKHFPMLPEPVPEMYFPLEFMVAVLNNGGGFYDTETYVQEARMLGVRIEPPCINHSDHPNTITGKTIYLGLGYLKSLEDLVIQRILNERQFHGAFTSFDDFIDRVPISLEQLTILIRIEAFRFTGISKKELMWQAIFKTKATNATPHQNQLFKPEYKKVSIPDCLPVKLKMPMTRLN